MPPLPQSKPVSPNVTALMELCRTLTQQRCALAFSGGSDSTLLLHLLAACAPHTQQVIPLLAKTALLPPEDESAARALCVRLGISLHCVKADPLPVISHNPQTRCYHCKRLLFTALQQRAQALGCSVLIDGTNADDLKVYRPGLKALQELQILSPLAQCGITKAQVRALLTELGLQAWNRPAAPCLATRFAYGMELNASAIAAVGKAEAALKALGFSQLRLRVHPGSVARLEVPLAELASAAAQATTISALVKAAGLNYVTLDLQGLRSGSMDELLSHATN